MAKAKPTLAERLERLLLDSDKGSRPSHILRAIESAAVGLPDHAQENLSDLIEWLHEAEALARTGKLAETPAGLEAAAQVELPPLEEASEQRPAKRKKSAVEIVGPPEPGTVTTARLFIDGGARGNPGPAAIGLVMENEDGDAIWTHAETIGDATNNVAEYSALIRGLTEAKRLVVERLEIFSDAELIVKQLTGEYKVKNALLKPLHAQAVSLRRALAFCRVSHIPRAKNKIADALVNQALDEAAGDF